ncbi:MAG: type II toxin-antitoxin system RelB/DinJ family antitoxin [Clostridia bacterium]
MSTSNVTIRLDDELKAAAEELFKDLGFNLTTAFTIFAKQAVREQRLPFEVSRAYNNETIAAIENARKGVGLSKEFSSISELMEDLNA